MRGSVHFHSWPGSCVKWWSWWMILIHSDTTTPAQEQEATRKATEATGQRKSPDIHFTYIDVRSCTDNICITVFKWGHLMEPGNFTNVGHLNLNLAPFRFYFNSLQLYFKSFDINCVDLQTCRHDPIEFYFKFQRLNGINCDQCGRVKSKWSGINFGVQVPCWFGWQQAGRSS